MAYYHADDDDNDGDGDVVFVLAVVGQTVVSHLFLRPLELHDDGHVKGDQQHQGQDEHHESVQDGLVVDLEVVVVPQGG